MHRLIEQHRDSIAELCRRYGVRRLEVFGSAARGTDFDFARSDVDFLVEFEPGIERGFAARYFAFEEALQKMLGRKVDLVDPTAIRNPYFHAAIDESRWLLYAA